MLYLQRQFHEALFQLYFRHIILFVLNHEFWLKVYLTLYYFVIFLSLVTYRNKAVHVHTSGEVDILMHVIQYSLL